MSPRSTRIRPLRRRLKLTGAFTAIALMAAPAAALADPCSSGTGNFWTGPGGTTSAPTSGAFGTAGNWSDGVVPDYYTTNSDAPQNFACLEGSTTYTVTMQPAQAYGNEDSIAGLDIGSGSGGTQTLEVLGASALSSSLETQNSTELEILATGATTDTIAKNGELVLEASNTNDTNYAGTTNGGEADLFVDGSSGDVLTNYGKILLSQTGGVTYLDQLEAPTINNEPGGSIEVGSGVTANIPFPGGISPMTFNNAGATQVDSGATLNSNSNAGANRMTINDTGTFANLGTTNLTSGVDWNQNATGLSGNLINAIGAGVDDLTAAGGSSTSGGGFNFAGGGGGGSLQGTVPAGQTISMSSSPDNEQVYLTGSVINDGTFNMDAPANSNGNPEVDQANGGGTLTNNGTMNLTDETGSFSNLWRTPFTNGAGGVINDESGNIYFDSGSPASNAGTIVIDPGAHFNWQNGVFTNTGTISPQIASASSFGLFKLNGGTLTAGGSLAPVLVGGFTPSVGQEFDVIPIGGATFSGTFGSVKNGFSADYTHQTSSPAYVGAIYAGTASGSGGSTPTTTPQNLALGKLRHNGKLIDATVSCPSGGSCPSYQLRATVTEHLKHGKLHAVTANAKHKKPSTIVVTVAHASGSVPTGESTTITLHFDRLGQSLLRRFHHLPVKVTLTSNGHTTSQTILLTQTTTKVKRHE